MDITNLKTPCFILDEAELVRNIREFDTALHSKFNKSFIGYSVKTNALPYVLRLAKDNGCYAEVVSYHEYNLALKVGFDKRHIIYNGPLKSKSTFLQAVGDGALVNIENWREIEWLRDLPNGRRYGIGIRLNINISKISPEDAACDDDDSRFGFSFESGEFQQALKKISSIGNIDVVGLHSHREPKTRSVGFYRHVISYVANIVSQCQLHLDYWDLGGGFFGIMSGKPTYQQYVDGFYEALPDSLRDVTIVVEPGNAIVASAFDYRMEVIDVKHHDGKIYVCTDGTRNDVDPFFRKTDYFKELVLTNPIERPLAGQPQVIGGLSCLEYDRLFQLPAGSVTLTPGDIIVFHRVGAYTIALSPLFIHYFPNVYVSGPSGLLLIRKEWDENNFIIGNNY